MRAFERGVLGPRWVVPVLFVATVALSSSSTAVAAGPSVTVSGTVLTIVGTPSPDTLELSCDSFGDIRLDGAKPSFGDSSCDSVTEIVERLGGGNDRAYAWEQDGFDALVEVSIFGEKGDDYLVANDWDYRLVGGAGDDTLRVNHIGSKVDGGSGTDTLDVPAEADVTVGDSTVAGEGLTATFESMESATLLGVLVYGEDTTIDTRGFPGAVFVSGGDGNNTILTGPGDDEIEAGPGRDTVESGRGKDVLHGEAGNDHLFGQIGDDTIKGGRGTDSCDGGSGKNRVSDCE